MLTVNHLISVTFNQGTQRKFGGTDGHAIVTFLVGGKKYHLIDIKYLITKIINTK